MPLYGALELNSSGNIVRNVLNNVSGKPMIDKFGGSPLAVSLSYLDKNNKATILSSPRVVVQDGEEASFENATSVPYMSASNNNNYGTSTTTGTSTTNPYAYYGSYYGIPTAWNSLTWERYCASFPE